jgi:hypothetical protein
MSSQQNSNNSNLDQNGPFSGNSNGVDIQQTSIDNVYANTVAPAPQNTTFEVYLPLDGHIYYITYTKLNILEIARLLNNRVDLSHIPDDQFPQHHVIQSLIQQQVPQQPADYQQQQQYFGQSTSHVYSNDNTYDAASNGATFDDVRDTGYDRSNNNAA